MSPAFVTVSRESSAHGSIDLNVAVVGRSEDPLILCVHGWPESWHSWSNQMAHFSARGYRVAAMDVRGYGASSRPETVEAYRLTELCGDVAAVVRDLSPDAPAVLFGHDWGAPIAYNTARLFAPLVRAVAGLSVPYGPASPGDPMELWNALYVDQFFYMKYFQATGVAEAAFEADLPTALRKVYYSASGDAPSEYFLGPHAEETAFLDVLVDPDPAPDWMSNVEITAMVEHNAGRSTHGWFNRYRAQKFDGDDISGVGEPILAQPACFIAGAEDVVRKFVPGLDIFDSAAAGYADSRGTTVIDGAGHWVHQERPIEVNTALAAFLDGL